MSTEADFPDAENAYIDYLTAQNPGVPVSDRVLPDAKSIRVWRTGGPRRDRFTDNAQLTIECRDTDSVNASALATKVRGQINRTSGRFVVPGVQCKGITEYSGPYNDPDDEHESSRYSWTIAAALKTDLSEGNPQ